MLTTWYLSKMLAYGVSSGINKHWKVSSYCFLASILHAGDLPCLNRCLKVPCRCTDRACQWMYLSVLPCSPVRWSAMKIKINAKRLGNSGKRSWWARLWSLVDSTSTASSISSVHRGSTWFSSPAGRAACDWLCAALCTATSFWICGGFKPNPGRRPNHPSANFLASDKSLQSISADLKLHSCSSWPSQVGKELLQLVSQHLVEESSWNDADASPS